MYPLENKRIIKGPVAKLVVEGVWLTMYEIVAHTDV